MTLYATTYHDHNAAFSIYLSLHVRVLLHQIYVLEVCRVRIAHQHAPPILLYLDDRNRSVGALLFEMIIHALRDTYLLLLGQRIHQPVNQGAVRHNQDVRGGERVL